MTPTIEKNMYPDYISPSQVSLGGITLEQGLEWYSKQLKDLTNQVSRLENELNDLKSAQNEFNEDNTALWLENQTLKTEIERLETNIHTNHYIIYVGAGGADPSIEWPKAQATAYNKKTSIDEFKRSRNRDTLAELHSDINNERMNDRKRKTAKKRSSQR